MANKVDPEVIALQMTKNSQKNNPEKPITFTAEEMPIIAKFYSANRTRSALSKQQTPALIREQGLADNEGELALAD